MRPTSPDRYDEIVEVRKFNPYHDALGRFSTASGAASFTFKPGASRAHDLAIQRAGGKISGSAGSGAPKKEPEKKERQYKKVGDQEVDAMRWEMGQDMTPEDIDQVMIHFSNHQTGGYFGTGNSFSINAALRSGDTSGLSGDDWKTIDAMDRNMKPITQDIQLTRMVDAGFFESFGLDPDLSIDQWMLDDIVGQVYCDHGYMSTSFDPDENLFGGRSITMNINAPAGTKALVRPDMDEAEIALARNTKMEVKGIRKGPKGWRGEDTFIVDLEVIVN